MALSTVLLCLLALNVRDLFPEVPDTEADLALREQVERLLAQPVDLNQATFEQLLDIPWLNPLRARDIIRFRDSLGRFDRVGQLRFVPGMSDELIVSLGPVVTVSAGMPPPWSGSMTTRVRSVPVSVDAETWSAFSRVNVTNGPWQAVGLAERDPGEAGLFDWVGGGLAFSRRRVRVVLGDYSLASGRGLVFSPATARSSSSYAEQGPAAAPRLANSAVEASGTRGLAAGFGLGGLATSVMLSLAGRDARLRPDGTVERLSGSGRHDDSASIAERGQLRELASGLSIGYRRSSVGVSLNGECIRYGRDFAPSDSSDSFYGNELAVVSVGADAMVGGYRLGGEAAMAGTGGSAFALDVVGDWAGVGAGVNLRGRTRQYFAPHGRWTGMANRQDRLEVAGNFRYRVAGFNIRCRGNTYRDFDEDSLPARVDFTLGQDFGAASAELVLGRSYKAEAVSYRTGRAELSVKPWPGGAATLTLADEYPQTRDGRGRMASLGVSGHWRRLSFSLTGARFDIEGKGISMYLREPGAMRIGASYSTSRSAWRTSAGVGLAVGGARLGLKTGCEWAGSPVLDMAAQLDMVLGR